MIILYGITNCDTVKKARAWLDAQALEHAFHDFKKNAVPADKLPVWCQAVGWEKLLNRRGTTWQKLSSDTQANAKDAASAQTLMQAYPSLIKRPVVQWCANNEPVTVGFDALLWEQVVKKLSSSSA